jgi:hypothetical protein
VKALSPALRKRVVIGSKIVPNKCNDVINECNGTLKRLGIDSIDLYMVHGTSITCHRLALLTAALLIGPLAHRRILHGALRRCSLLIVQSINSILMAHFAGAVY